MDAVIFRSNGQTIGKLMSIFVPKPDFLAHFRVEHFLTIFDFNQVAIFPYYTEFCIQSGDVSSHWSHSWRVWWPLWSHLEPRRCHLEPRKSHLEPVWLLQKPLEGQVSMGRVPGGCRLTAAIWSPLAGLRSPNPVQNLPKPPPQEKEKRMPQRR